VLSSSRIHLFRQMMHYDTLAKVHRRTTRIALLLLLLLPLLSAQDPNPHIVHKPPTRPGTVSPAPGTFDTDAETQLFGLINQTRGEHGLPPLTVDSRLTQAARKHTSLMVQHSQLSHQFEDEPPLQIRFSDENLPSDHEGENLDLNQDVASAHQALMDSPPHRRSILDPSFNVVGIVVLHSGENIYVTEDFAHRLPMYSEPEAEAVLQGAVEKAMKSHEFPTPVRRSQPQLRQMACSMALNDSLDSHDPAKLTGVSEVFVWTAGDPANIPVGVEKRLSQQLPSGYALGACFAPSVGHPGGVYWVIMVAY
jgi:uncharacterized protein YkwD